MNGQMNKQINCKQIQKEMNEYILNQKNNRKWNGQIDSLGINYIC